MLAMELIMRKQYLSLIIALLLCLTACNGKNNTATANPPETATATIAPTPVEPNTQKPATAKLEETKGEQKRVININNMPAPSLANNVYDEPMEKPLLVLLPPSYYMSEKSYPVVYFLHGHGDSEAEAFYYYNKATTYMESEKAKEFIIVGVNGINALGGSFYTDSPVIGNWEQYVTQDVITYVDSNFRTIPSTDARGISGFSMGGYSAINIALKHPDTFSSLFAIAPGLFDEEGLTNAFGMWDQGFKESYAAAFAPNMDKLPPFFDIPTFDGSEQDNIIIEKWKNGFGNLSGKISAYKAMSETAKLKAIHIEYGSHDRYPWIPEGCKYFSTLLNENDIEHELVEFSGTHMPEHPVTIDNFIMFFSDHF